MPTIAEATSHWVHDINPVIIRIHGDIALRWYGLSYVVGILVGLWILNRWIKKGWVPFRPGEGADFALYVGLGMVIGGRLGHCILYQHGFWHDPLHFFRVWEGGMASHGGIVGMAVGTGLFAWKRGRSFWVLADQVAALAPLGVAMGRVANFINGELWGRASQVSWAVFFPKASPVDPEKVPWALAKEYSTVAKPAAWVQWVASKSEWYVQENWRFVPRHPSQIYAAFLEGILPFAVLLLIHPRHRRPAVTVGCCFILYGLGRFIDEFWREPDVGQPIFFGWMSKGQLYTIPVLVIGAILLYVTLRRNPRPALYVPPPEPKGKANGKKK